MALQNQDSKIKDSTRLITGGHVVDLGTWTFGDRIGQVKLKIDLELLRPMIRKAFLSDNRRARSSGRLYEVTVNEVIDVPGT